MGAIIASGLVDTTSGNPFDFGFSAADLAYTTDRYFYAPSLTFALDPDGDHVLDFQDGFGQIKISGIVTAPEMTGDRLIGYGSTLDGTGTVIWVGSDFIVLNGFNVANLDALDFYVG